MPHCELESLHGCNGRRIICGVDEVGRGPIAGPVVAAAVILPPDGLPDVVAARIDDSKKLSARQREALFAVLTETCDYAVAEASVAEIDRINILQASMLAMQRAVAGLRARPDCALVDGNRAPDVSCEVVTVVKGDSISLSIAAASIIAKVVRDRLMTDLAEAFPGYGWERNAGYPTVRHIEALQILGVTAWHRRSFAPVAQCLLLTG